MQNKELEVVVALVGSRDFTDYELFKIKVNCPDQKSVRLYAYLTTLKKQLVKVTIAVKTYKKQWHCKQVAVHGVKSNKCYVKDMEYNHIGMGFRFGWYAEGWQKHKKWFESDYWYDADFKYYNPYAKVVNPEFIGKFSEYRYSGYQYFKGLCIINYLKLYEKYPQTEYLLKLGLFKIHDSITVLKRVAKDKKFCKWLIANKTEIAENDFYVSSIMLSYKTGRPIKYTEMFERFKKNLSHNDNLSQIKELFKNDLRQFFSYLENQKSDPYTYLDYLKACNYLGLDMSLAKNRYPMILSVGMT